MSKIEYRASVLNALGVTFTNDDLTNTIKWRKKVIEGLLEGGSGGGGALPANFPKEDISNANMFFGWDEQGKYAALEAPSGGNYDAFFDINDFVGNVDVKSNTIQSPYTIGDVLDNALILGNGTIRTTGSDTSWFVSPLIPVYPGMYGLKVIEEKYDIGDIAPGNNGFGFFDSDGETVVARSSEITNLGNNIYLIEIPNGASYIRFSVRKNSESNTQRALDKFNQWILLPNADSSITEDFFENVGTAKENGTIRKIVRVDGSTLYFLTSELAEKKILVFGDSIWGNDRTAGVSNFLAEYSGATVYNCAIGGTRITGDRSTYSGAPAWKAFDGANLIHAKLENDFTDQDQYASDVASYVATETLPLLKSVNLSKIDIIILAYGHNDFSGDKTIAQITDAYKTVINEILTSYPKIRILVCCTPWRMFSGVDGDTYTNKNGDTLRDMDDGIIEMAKSMHVEVLDTLARLPWCALTKATYLDSDEVHPNTEGNKVYAHVVHGMLRSMY